MRAAILHDIRDIRIGEIPRPEPQPGEILLRVQAVGICGSDLHYYLEGGTTGSSQITSPLILGHEISAEIADDRAEEFGLTPGTLVAVDPARPCGHCEWCQRGHSNLCPHTKFAGSQDCQGALAEYWVAPLEALFPLPPEFDATTAALLEPLGVAIHAVDLAWLRSMETVAVIGAGPIGLLLVQVARLSGAGQVFAIDRLLYRTEAARRLGADEAADKHEAVLDWTQGRGVDVVLEATNSPLGPQMAAEIARIGGRVILTGIPSEDRYTISASVVRRKGLTFKLSRRMGRVYSRAIRMAQSGRVQLSPIVTHRFPLEQAPEAFALQANYHHNVLKTVIYPGKMPD